MDLQADLELHCPDIIRTLFWHRSSRPVRAIKSSLYTTQYKTSLTYQRRVYLSMRQCGCSVWSGATQFVCGVILLFLMRRYSYMVRGLFLCIYTHTQTGPVINPYTVIGNICHVSYADSVAVYAQTDLKNFTARLPEHVRGVALIYQRTLQFSDPTARKQILIRSYTFRIWHITLQDKSKRVILILTFLMKSRAYPGNEELNLILI